MTESDTDRPQSGTDADRIQEEQVAMADVSHTNPYTGDTFGGVYRRGPAVADGGKTTPHAVASSDSPDVDDDRTTVTASNETMGDVDHTPPNADLNDVWSRGHRDSGVAEHR